MRKKDEGLNATIAKNLADIETWELKNKENMKLRQENKTIPKENKYERQNDDIDECDIDFEEEYNPLLLNESAVHLPIDIYDQGIKLTNAY